MNTRCPITFLMHARGPFRKGQVGPACWPHFDLLWIHRGSVRIRFMQGPPVTLERDTGVLIYPETHFAGEADRDANASVQHFAFTTDAPDTLPGSLSDYAPRRSGYVCLHTLQPQQTQRDIDRALELGRLPQTPVVLDMRVAMLTLILGQLTAHPDAAAIAPRQQRRAFETLDAWIGANLSQGLTVADIAAHLNLSESHCRAVFTRHFRITPGRYLQRRRLITAATQLTLTNKPVKQIAQEAGYPQVANFHHAFRQHFGKTPGGYRRENQVHG